MLFGGIRTCGAMYTLLLKPVIIDNSKKSFIFIFYVHLIQHRPNSESAAQKNTLSLPNSVNFSCKFAFHAVKCFGSFSYRHQLVTSNNRIMDLFTLDFFFNYTCVVHHLKEMLSVLCSVCVCFSSSTEETSVSSISLPRISSLSGANRKRKRRDQYEDEENDEEQQEMQESESSSEEESDEEEAAAEEEVKEKDEQEQPMEVKTEEQKIEDKKEEEKKEMKKEATPSCSKEPCQPAVFIPVDRLPEIQVCVCVCFFVCI